MVARQFGKKINGCNIKIEDESNINIKAMETHSLDLKVESC